MYATATGYHGGLCRQDGVYCFALLVMVRTKRSEKSGLTSEPVYVTAKDGQIIARSSGGEAGGGREVRVCTARMGAREDRAVYLVCAFACRRPAIGTDISQADGFKKRVGKETSVAFAREP